MQETTEKTVAISFSALKITAEVLQNVIRLFLQKKSTKSVKPQKQSLRSLVKQGQKLTNIEITAQSIKAFDQIAKKYHVSYSAMRDGPANDQGLNNYVVFFKAADIERMDLAFKHYAQIKLEHKPSIYEKLTQKFELAKQMADRSPMKEKVMER